MAKDLVQDMYLKVYEINKPLNNTYIAKVISNLFLDYIKEENKKVSINKFDFKDNESNFELNDKETEILNNLSFLERELILIHYAQKLSYHEIQREYNINYQFARRKIENVKKKYKKE